MSTIDDATIAGGWLGTYVYKGLLQANPPVRFEARFIMSGSGEGQFSGTILDDCNLGEATVDGVVSGRSVKFTKTYATAKARSGQIEYQGLLSDDGNQMTGTWHMGKLGNGVWEARRSWQEDRKPEAVLESAERGYDREGSLIVTASS
jgi:hypothetical protein